MHDCLWYFIRGVCNCENCNNCKECISLFTDEGCELYEKYRADVKEALKPLTEKWKQIKLKHIGKNE